jgi:hypothetical protein
MWPEGGLKMPAFGRKMPEDVGRWPKKPEVDQKMRKWKEAGQKRRKWREAGQKRRKWQEAGQKWPEEAEIRPEACRKRRNTDYGLKMHEIQK